MTKVTMITVRTFAAFNSVHGVIQRTPLAEDKGISMDADLWDQEDLDATSEDALDHLCISYDAEVEAAIAEWEYEAYLSDKSEEVEFQPWEIKAIERHNRARGRTTNLVPTGSDVWVMSENSDEW